MDKLLIHLLNSTLNRFFLILFLGFTSLFASFDFTNLLGINLISAIIIKQFSVKILLLYKKKKNPQSNKMGLWRHGDNSINLWVSHTYKSLLCLKKMDKFEFFFWILMIFINIYIHLLNLVVYKFIFLQYHNL